SCGDQPNLKPPAPRRPRPSYPRLRVDPSPLRLQAARLQAEPETLRPFSAPRVSASPLVGSEAKPGRRRRRGPRQSRRLQRAALNPTAHPRYSWRLLESHHSRPSKLRLRCHALRVPRYRQLRPYLRRRSGPHTAHTLRTESRSTSRVRLSRTLSKPPHTTRSR